MLLALISGGCVSRSDLYYRSFSKHTFSNQSKNYADYDFEVRDNSPTLWTSKHPRIVEFRKHYLANNTVQVGLKRGQRYLPEIIDEFRRNNLPVELAYLPILESMFSNWADSGSARGMWQFTKQTAKHVGLTVSNRYDERLDWRKSTKAAIRYLKELGERFDYDWSLVLAAYNGGPNYIQSAIEKQSSTNFWNLDLRKETYEYVPRFVAMLQVARVKHPQLAKPLNI